MRFGLADALIMCGLRYGSPAAVAAAGEWIGAIRREAYLASTALAAEKGPFPLFDRDRYPAGETIRALDEAVRAAITSIAPTGTISLFADNVSSGIEPVFSFRHARNLPMPDGSRREDAPLPDYFIERHMIEIGFLPKKRERLAVPAFARTAGQAASGGSIADHRGSATGMPQCPKCGEAALVRREGCEECASCDYSKCW